ncbi:alpha/beta hydrolase [Coleofasciculus sp.]|uniref:alpha/beta hydrolase n=1 Tax=Coleofasciculus sp. TaxID=3100458 RepID=UPI003A39ADA8
MSNYLPLSKRLILGLITLLGVLPWGVRADAAESVVLKYRFLRETVSVEELTTFAETGELSTSLQAYLKMAGKEPAELRQVLTKEVAVNPILLHRVLNSAPGELLLDQTSQVIHTPTNRANRQSLRGALMSSALPNGKITLIETLQHYPTPEVHVEGNRLVEVVQRISRVTERLPNL